MLILRVCALISFLHVDAECLLLAVVEVVPLSCIITEVLMQGLVKLLLFALPMTHLCMFLFFKMHARTPRQIDVWCWASCFYMPAAWMEQS